MDTLKLVIEILIHIDEIISVSLFATLSVLSLAAAALLYARPMEIEKHDSVKEQYRGAILLSLGALSFMIGIPITILFDSVFEVLRQQLWIVVLDVIFTAIPFILGFLFLYSGLGNLIRFLISQEGRVIPKWLLSPIDKLVTRAVESVLKAENDSKID